MSFGAPSPPPLPDTPPPPPPPPPMGQPIGVRKPKGSGGPFKTVLGVNDAPALFNPSSFGSGPGNLGGSSSTLGGSSR